LDVVFFYRFVEVNPVTDIEVSSGFVVKRQQAPILTPDIHRIIDMCIVGIFDVLFGFAAIDIFVSARIV
jgi:hypothetical protein